MALPGVWLLFQVFKTIEIMISIIHPSRGRFLKSFDTIRKWLHNSSYYKPAFVYKLNKTLNIEVIVSLDDDDQAINDYREIYESIDSLNVKVIQNNNTSAVSAINYAATFAKGDILIVVSDDTDCPENWDELLLKEVEGKTDWILKTQDGIQKWIITMPVMDRAYYNRFGYIYYPEYRHMFCDTELSCVADLTGRRLESKLMFEHLHYSTGKSVKDAISDKADKTWDQGEKLFLERYQRNFDLKETPGRITSPEYLSWIKRKIK